MIPKPIHSRALLAGAVLGCGSAGAAVLEEVTVTAQKREQNVQDIGIAVTAFTGEQLRQLGYTNAQEVTALAPGVSTIQPNGEANYAIAIRGVAASDFTTNIESPVSIYVDEVYISQMSGAGFMLFDMERVEILRGPQGTLFGRNATGGLAHFVTRKPSSEFGGYGEVTVGEYEQVKLEGAIGGGSDRVAARLSAATHHNEGYVTNRVLEPLTDEKINNANDYAGRTQLLFTPSDDVELLFNVRGSRQFIRTGFFENVSSVIEGRLTPNTFNPIEGYIDNDGDVFAGDYDRFGHNELETYGVSGTLKWQLENMTLTSITDFQSVERDYIEDSDAAPIPLFNFFLTTDAEQFSQELRLNGELDNLEWVAGFYYLDIGIQDSNGAEGDLAFGAGLGLDNPYQTDTESWSVFGQAEYAFNEQWTGIFGFRWIEEDKTHDFVSNFVAFVPGTTKRGGNPNILAELGRYRGERDDGLWSAKLELDWRPYDDLLLYASWNRGVKGGGFNAPFDVSTVPAFDDATFSYDPEELDAYEFGFKSTLFDGLARLNGAFYYYDYANYQAFQIVGLATLVSNANADNLGFELELQATPTEGLDLLFGVGYADVDVTDVVLAGGISETTSVQTPEWNVNGLARYEWPAFGGTMALQGDFQYRSEHFFSLTQAETVTEDGYAVVNAALSWTSEDDHWTARLFVNNLADEEYLVQTFDLSGNVFGMTEQYYGRPRWVGGSIAYRF